MQTDRPSDQFVALGHAGSEHYAGLETFSNPGVSRVEMTSDEFSPEGLDELLGESPALWRRAGPRSGVGRVGGRFSMETFTGLKTVVVNLG
ncbi:MAG TPA: hypothetical protein VGU71_06545 [Candidatus Dormibacteraeota bacterium]|nr:hypothetical protein [Candidatus Dormibacteraeota bacterium]